MRFSTASRVVVISSKVWSRLHFQLQSSGDSSFPCHSCIWWKIRYECGIAASSVWGKDADSGLMFETDFEKAWNLCKLSGCSVWRYIDIEELLPPGLSHLLMWLNTKLAGKKRRCVGKTSVDAHLEERIIISVPQNQFLLNKNNMTNLICIPSSKENDKWVLCQQRPNDLDTLVVQTALDTLNESDKVTIVGYTCSSHRLNPFR